MSHTEAEVRRELLRLALHNAGRSVWAQAIVVSFVAMSVGAVVFYEERVNFMKVAGMALILVGVAMVGGAKA